MKNAKKPRPIRVVTVTRKRDLPPESGRMPCADVTAHTIFVTRKTPKSVVEHERYHILKRHPRKPRDPVEYVRQEFEAMLYSYKKTGHPRHILHRLYGLTNEINHGLYRYGWRDTYRIISAAMSKLDVPRGWLEDKKKWHGKMAKLGWKD